MKTAEEFLKNFTYQHEGKTYHLGEWENSDQENEVKLLMIEFAQMHVEEALQSASDWVGEIDGVDFNLKNAYPLTNIK